MQQSKNSPAQVRAYKSVFDVSFTVHEDIQKLFDQIMVELGNWYEFSWTQNKPKLYIVEDQEIFFALAGKEKANWVRGFADYGNRICVYSPLALEKYTIHKYSEKSYYSFLKHELDHCFFNVHTKGLRQPTWLIEGNAVLNSQSNEMKHQEQPFEAFLSMDSQSSPVVYNEAANAVKLLIQKIGKKEYTDFLKDLGQKDFNNEFENKFGIQLRYNDFNVLMFEVKKGA